MLLKTDRPITERRGDDFQMRRGRVRGDEFQRHSGRRGSRAMFAQRYNGGAAATDREIAAYYAPFGEWKGLLVWLDVMRDTLLSRLA